MPSILVLFISIISCITESEKEKDPVLSFFEPAFSAGIIQNQELQEASGLVASRQNPGLFWVINDSGNEAKLFLINNKAETIHTYELENCENNDWEDLAIYYDKVSGKHKLIIGDIGDNFSSREDIKIIILDEPSFVDQKDSLMNNYNIYSFNYKDGARDAETIIYDPISSKLLIISKREENVGLYEVPDNYSETETKELLHIINLPFNNLTSGDITIDGNEVLLKTYDAIYFWQRNIDERIQDVLSKDHQSVDYKIEPQGESICWDINGEGFYTLSEKSWASNQVLYYYKRKSNN